jgi:signal transduction histidine kinase
MMRFTLTISLLIACLAPVAAPAEPARPRSMLVLSESDVRGPFYYEVFSALRSEVSASDRPPITLYVENLDLRRFSGPVYEEGLQVYLRSKYFDRPLGAIIAMGSVPLEYALRSAALWPGVPIIFSMVDETALARLKLPPEVTGRILKLNLNDMMMAARAVVHDLERIVILGEPWERQTFNRNIPNEIQAAAGDVEVVDLTGVPLQQLRRRVAELPDRTAIIYTGIFSDGEGTFYSPADALALVAAAANRPIVISTESLLGRGGIGGFVQLPTAVGKETAQLAMRVLDGEPVSSIPIAVGDNVRPIFDWQQMKRWGVSESSLPAGSEIRFRDPSLWDQNRAQILAICAALLVQAGLIGWLIFEHRRRHRAEIQSRNAMTELTYMNRRSTAGQLSASIAHELLQPLTGITTRASAGLRWLRAETPNLERAGVALEQIVVAGHRASDIITSVRAMFRKDTSERRPVDINGIILTVLAIVRIDLQRNHVELQTQFDESVLMVEGDKVQLQQVILNLVMNAIEAMQSVRPRVLKVKSEQSRPEMIHVSIEDTGTGIDPSNLNRVFSPLFTTKERGMGMGLSICHSIIESHNGRIWVSPGVTKGSIFQFELPTKSGKDAGSFSPRINPQLLGDGAGM